MSAYEAGWDEGRARMRADITRFMDHYVEDVRTYFPDQPEVPVRIARAMASAITTIMKDGRP